MSANQRSANVVIVGGSIMGTSLAWQLARRGAGRVTLLERAIIGAGARGKTGALLRRHYSNRPEAILAHRGWQTFAAWPELVGGDPVHTPLGLIVTVDTSPGRADNVARLQRNVAMQNELGIPSRVVDREELRALQPQADWDDVTHAAYEPDSGYVDAIAATHGMTRAALARVMPAMRGAAPLHGHAGRYDMTPDAHPIIGPAGPAGLFLIAGFSGAGFK